MSTSYPGGIDSYTTKVDGVDVVAAAHLNNLQDAATALETELGVLPKGSFASVAAAIAAKLNASGGNLTGDVTANAGVKVDGVDISAHIHSGASGDAANVPWSNVSGKPPMMNTVFGSAVDASGLPNFISIGTGLSVNIDGNPTPVKMDVNGFFRKIDSDTTISGLTPSTTCFLYAEKVTGVTPTLGHSTQKPMYSYTPPGSPPTDMHWFDLSERQMKRWTGSAWEYKSRIFIGEAVTDASSVTSVVNYALCGMYDSDWFSVAQNTQYTKNHNLGITPSDIQLLGASSITPPSNIHDVIYYHNGTNGYGGQVGAITELNFAINAAANFQNPIFYLGTSGTSGYYRVIARRGW